jgi:hypothetical protein
VCPEHDGDCGYVGNSATDVEEHVRRAHNGPGGQFPCPADGCRATFSAAGAKPKELAKPSRALAFHVKKRHEKWFSVKTGPCAVKGCTASGIDEWLKHMRLHYDGEVVVCACGYQRSVGAVRMQTHKCKAAGGKMVQLGNPP